MSHAESIQEFYARVMHTDVHLNNAGSGHFNVFPRQESCRKTPYGRRDYYKVSLMLGTGRLFLGDGWTELDKPVLLLSNPLTPYAWEAVSESQKGWYCLFTESFLLPNGKRDALMESALFRIGMSPAFFVDKKQQKALSDIFKKMMEEMASDYAYKFDLQRSYLHLILHEVMKMEPVAGFEQHTSASLRIAHLFLALLERQFPIDAPDTPLRLKTANQFAESLSVHVNHLNRALKEATGKTTTEHIAERVVKEAVALLRYTDWDVAQIAYGLGFEYPAYFNNFFKKQTGLTPVAARTVAV